MAPQNGVSGLSRLHSSAPTAAGMAPIVQGDVSMSALREDLAPIHKVEEANAKMKAEISNLRAWMQTAKMLTEQKAANADEIKTSFAAKSFGLGVTASLLVSLVYKVFFTDRYGGASRSIDGASGAEMSSA